MKTSKGAVYDVLAQRIAKGFDWPKPFDQALALVAALERAGWHVTRMPPAMIERNRLKQVEEQSWADFQAGERSKRAAPQVPNTIQPPRVR